MEKSVQVQLTYERENKNLALQLPKSQSEYLGTVLFIHSEGLISTSKGLCNVIIYIKVIH